MNLTFVPIALLAGGVYRTRQDVARAMLRLAVFGVLVGALAMYQSTLPVDHWLNRGMNLANGLDDRVSGTFQYPTVFGNFLMGGTIASLAAVTVVTKKSTKLLLGLGWLAFEIGGFMSGSRMGSLGSAIILVPAAIMSTKRVRRTALIVAAVLTSFVALTAGALKIYRTELTGLNLRATETMDLGARIQDFYFGDRLRDALVEAHGLGTRMGPYTMGIEIYSKRLGFEENLAPNYQDRGGYSYLDGGTPTF